MKFLELSLLEAASLSPLATVAKKSVYYCVLSNKGKKNALQGN
jgi:hypothetical protein